MYQPAPKPDPVGDRPAPQPEIVGDRSSRRPLVQGRLTTGGGQEMVHVQPLVQGELQDDPTIQPAKSLPVLTENMSSRPEPLQCLDLSDTEADVSYGDRPQPVMVFDASAQADPAAGAEVDVVMVYEQSPARVICHTPGKLQLSLRQQTSTNISALSAGDGPDISVRVDRVQNVAGVTPKAAQHCHIVLHDKENLNRLQEARTRSSEASGHYRGIIEEILRQELGNSNVDAISLQSETSPFSSKHLTGVSPASKSQRQSDSVNDSQNGDLPADSCCFPQSSQTKQQKQKMNINNKSLSFPQPHFDDSDTSVDQVPVKDSMENQQAKLHDDYSGSETCSLYEYVTPNKYGQQVGFNKFDATAKPLADKELASVSTKKKKVRKVTSRYLQSSASKTTAHNQLASKSSSMEASVLKPHSRSQPAGLSVGRQTREKQHADMRADLGSRKTVSGQLTRTNNNVQATAAQTHTQRSVVVTSSRAHGQSDSPQQSGGSAREFTNVEQKTSTPTHDQTCHLSSQDIDASAIHSMSAMSINTSLPGIHPLALANKTNKDAPVQNLMTQKSSNKRNTNRPNADHMSSTWDTSQLQLDLEHTRYLQWAFLNSKVSHMLQEQEQHTSAHMHALWKIVESSREVNAGKKADVSRLKQINLLDSILDKTGPDLDTVVSLLPQLEEYYCRLSSALDTTRHQLVTRDIYMPQVEQPQDYEDQLETALTESEQLLTELSELTGDRVLPLGQYLDCMEAIQKNVLSTFSELTDSQTDVATLKGLSTRLTSLSVQEMQL
ncbi:hypothetical protein BsWGS_14500 [Bradybaena similaris]